METDWGWAVAKQIEDVKRWNQQEKERIISELTKEELKELLNECSKSDRKE
jgi:hypothetical protein